MTNDLVDIVQNADLQEWQEIFVMLCTFASQEATEACTINFRRNATLTYLTAEHLERLVNIWIEELVEEERQLVSDDGLNGSQLSSRKKVTISHYLKLTPEDYHGSPGSALDFKVSYGHLLKAASTTPVLERTVPLPPAVLRAAPIASTGSSYATS
ncbi:hypothetical protein WOLCODRAFT_17418 [Wolfiporia cocos MD-104 SS10]|uniref:Uncharacterized protein n=1 Tax=Wolfiporia cocos (strain MD-104) TaxID=742152 RepID=A0A2H3JVV4_WOLCO|nr:hypothetical protein WOLCODRAFT_17418 [Wolfiporia cocos MD-104 SS10]